MELSNERVIFSILWVALMLIYLLGDVLRIFAGDFIGGEIDGKPMSQYMWFLIAIMMVIPIVMVILNILVPGSYMKWPNIILAGAFFLINIIGIAGYKPYDQFLLVISFILNGITIYLAFRIY